uniref:Putative ovule protein n=1 Tax=Solanum chacoense TaxID=4108 RepID=A0A0V0GK24_SOLCH
MLDVPATYLIDNMEFAHRLFAESDLTTALRDNFTRLQHLNSNERSRIKGRRKKDIIVVRLGALVCHTWIARN